MVEFPVIGAVYRHYKGSFYVVINICQDANADTLTYTKSFDEAVGPGGVLVPLGERTVVVYMCLEDGTWWVRTLEDFMAVIDEDPVQRRFELIRVS